MTQQDPSTTGGFGIGVLERLSASFAQWNKLRVRVTKGPFQGAEIVVPRDFRCGSDLGDDVTLLTPEISPAHFSVVADARPFGGMKLDATGGAVVINDKVRIEKGQWARTGLPASVEIGETALSIAPALNLLRHAETAGLAAVVAIGLVAAAGIGTKMLGPTNGRTGLDAGYRPQSHAAARSSTSAESRERNAQGFESARKRLAELGLAPQISLTSDNGTGILASGKVGTEESEQWREFLRWYDSNRDLPPLLNSVTRLDQPRSMPRIAAAILGSEPRLLLDNGDQKGVGEIIGNDLVISAITRDAVVTRRGKDTIELKLPGSGKG